MVRAAIAILCAFVASMMLTACGLQGGDQIEQEVAGSASTGQAAGRQPGQTAGAGTSADPISTPLANDNWEQATRDAEKYRGSEVTITGEVFNVLGEVDGFYRFQIYTDPAAGKGNTHVATRENPRVKKGYQVKVVGTLQGVRTARAVSGRELRIPEVEAESVLVIGPPSVVTPTAVPSPTAEPSPTSAPTATATPKPLTPTLEPTAEPSPVAVATSAPPPAATEVPPTETPTPAEEPSATPEPAESTAEATPDATATPADAAGPTSAPVGGPLPLLVDAGLPQASGAMTVKEDAAAPSGRYISSGVSDQGWTGEGDPPPNTGEAVVQVEVPGDGTYAIWTRMWYAHVDGNSYWLMVDDQPAIKVGNDGEGYKEWKWVGWRDGSTSERVTVDLTSGTHTLRLVGREAGTRIDSILVTDDLGYVPE